MKLSTKILLFIFLLIISGLLSSNMILKNQYNAIDKSDIYWTYNKVLEQPFRHLNITGGNDTHIYYQQSETPSVRLLQEWVSRMHGGVKASIKHDTLFLIFDYVPSNPFEKHVLESSAPVRIFSPELLSVTGNNMDFEIHRFRQKSITADISGKSRFEVESLYPELDSVFVRQSDSSTIKLEMSPDYRKKTSLNDRLDDIFDASMSINFLTATIKDHSILDVGHAQIKKLQAHVSDSSAIVLSGDALRKINLQ